MRYGVHLKKLEGEEKEYFFESLIKFSKFLKDDWKLSTSSIKDIIPLARDVTLDLKIPIEWKDEKWEVFFSQKATKVISKRDPEYAAANFKWLEIRLHHHLPDIISLLEKEKERVDSAKKFVSEFYEKFKGFAPKAENVNVSEIKDVEECLSAVKDFYSSLEERLEKIRSASAK